MICPTWKQFYNVNVSYCIFYDRSLLTGTVSKSNYDFRPKWSAPNKTFMREQKLRLSVFLAPRPRSSFTSGLIFGHSWTSTSSLRSVSGQKKNSTMRTCSSFDLSKLSLCSVDFLISGGFDSVDLEDVWMYFRNMEFWYINDLETILFEFIVILSLNLHLWWIKI